MPWYERLTMTTSDRPAGERSATVRSLAVGTALAVPIALVTLVFGVIIALLLAAPSSGLLPVAWRVLLIDPGAWLAVAIAIVALASALRPLTPAEADDWLARRGLSRALAGDAVAEVRRARSWRTVPTVLGACVWVGRGLAANLAIAQYGAGDPRSLALVDAAVGSGSAAAFTLGGYLFGVVVAEATRRRPAPDVPPASRSQAPGGVRVASFAERRPAAYLTPVARALPMAVAALLLIAVGTVAVIDGGLGRLQSGPVAVVVAMVGLLAGVPAVQWLVVRRPQHVGDPDALALDDTFRSSTAHAVVGATAAGGIAVVSVGLNRFWDLGLERGGGAVMWLLALVGLGLSVASITVWLGYGSGHRGARPTVDVP
jgi:hypothetical protein